MKRKAQDLEAAAVPADYHDYYDGEKPYEECWQEYFCERYTVDLIREVWGWSPPYRLLDCGSACGLTLPAFASIGVEAWGVENSEHIHSRTSAKWRKRNLLGDVRNLPFADGSFEFVYDTSLCYVPEKDLDRAICELHRVCTVGVFHGTLTTEMTLGGTDNEDNSEEDARSLYPLPVWSDIFLRNGFRPAITDPDILVRIWQIEREACAKAGQVPWYPGAETMSYCFYSKPTPVRATNAPLRKQRTRATVRKK